jgi:hypothetical protein
MTEGSQRLSPPHGSSSVVASTVGALGLLVGFVLQLWWAAAIACVLGGTVLLLLGGRARPWGMGLLAALVFLPTIALVSMVGTVLQ